MSADDAASQQSVVHVVLVEVPDLYDKHNDDINTPSPQEKLAMKLQSITFRCNFFSENWFQFFFFTEVCSFGCEWFNEAKIS